MQPPLSIVEITNAPNNLLMDMVGSYLSTAIRSDLVSIFVPKRIAVSASQRRDAQERRITPEFPSSRNLTRLQSGSLSYTPQHPPEFRPGTLCPRRARAVPALCLTPFS